MDISPLVMDEGELKLRKKNVENLNINAFRGED